MDDEPVPERIGDYLIERPLGEGGMAKVYQARHAILDSRHAIKVLDPSYRANPAARQRFLDEAKIQASQLDHPNIVKVVNIVATAEHAALVMELIEGSSLESRVGDLKDDPALIREIMLAVLDAVGYAHEKGIIHRDLKPANVLLAQRGGQLIPKVTDFGIAKITGGGTAKKSTHADARMGTLTYSSPEQFRSAKDVTPRSDVFSLGAMLYELATGQAAFPGDNDYDVMDAIVKGRFTPPEQHHPAIDPTISAVIRKALEPDPLKRFASCQEMADALTATSSQSSAIAAPQSSPPAAPQSPPAAPRPSPTVAPLPPSPIAAPESRMRAPLPPTAPSADEPASINSRGRSAMFVIIGVSVVALVLVYVMGRRTTSSGTQAVVSVPADAIVLAPVPAIDAFVPADAAEPTVDAMLPGFDQQAGAASLAAVAAELRSCKRRDWHGGDRAGVVIVSLTFDPATGHLIDAKDLASPELGGDTIFDPREATCMMRKMEAAPSVPPFSGPKKTITKKVIIPPRKEPVGDNPY